MLVVNLYTEQSLFVDVANVRWSGHRPPALVEYRNRFFLRHGDGNYYEASCAHSVELEPRLSEG